MSEAFEFLVGVLHLIVLRVEDHALLDLLHVSLVDSVVADAQLLNAEVGLEGVTNSLATCLSNLTVEHFNLHEGQVVPNQLSDSISSYLSQVTVPEFKQLESVVLLLENAAQLLSTLPVQFTVGDVELFNLSIGLEHRHEQHEVLSANVVLTEVEYLDSVCVSEGYCKVLDSQTVVE